MKIFKRVFVFRYFGRSRSKRRRRGRDRRVLDGVGEVHPNLNLPTNEKEKSGEGDWDSFWHHELLWTVPC